MVASIRAIVSFFTKTEERELQAIERSKNLTQDNQDGLHGLLNEIFHLSGESLIIVSLNYTDETGEGEVNNSFYGAVKKYCDLNNELHCLNIPPLDKTKIFENDPHYNHLGTEYVANIIQDYIEDINFLRSKNL